KNNYKNCKSSEAQHLSSDTLHHTPSINMYRIISGRWKSKRISAPKNFNVRPTTDFAKEALFSIIENRFNIDMTASSVLDLFAGIGSVSLEFASRGCQDVTSVELNAKHAAFISTTAA